MEAILTSRQSFERRQTGWGPSLCQAEAHECNLFLLEGPRVFIDYRGEKKKGKWGGTAVPFRFQVTSLLQICPEADRQKSHMGECPLKCSGKFPDLEECCVTPSDCSLWGSSQNRDSFERSCREFGKSGYSHPETHTTKMEQSVNLEQNHESMCFMDDHP